jgi:two-component system, chemotaxis family, CheB/CheR fusion protein
MAERLTAAELPPDSLRKLIDGASRCALIGMSADGKISLWSRGAEHLFGWEEAEVLGQSITIISTQEDRTAGVLQRHLAEARRTGYAEEVRCHVRKDGTQFWANGVLTPLEDDRGYVKVLRDWTEQHEADQVLVAELQHRTRNLLALVRSIATHTLESAGSLQDFGRQFNSRLAALGRIQSRSARNDVPPTLEEIVKAELNAHGAPVDGERVRVEGPPVALIGSTAQILTLAIHELGANALQYGALGVDSGRLRITWSVEDTRLRLNWRESGLPVGQDLRPTHWGFGRELIEHVLAYDLLALTRFELTPDGLHCSIDIPISEPA